MVGNMLDPYFASISESVTVEADNFGLAAMVTNMRRDPLREIELTRRFLEHRVSGVILSGGGYDQDTHQDLLTESLSALTNAGCYVASLTERNFDIPTFCADNDLIGQLAARALLDHGHSRIAVVYAPETSQVTRARRKATLGLLESRGCCVTEVVASYSREAGYAAADEVFASKRHDWPTGVIAGSDSLALGVLDYLNVHGVSVPEDVSVVGIGATYMSEFARPRLTSISVAVAESALAAVNYLANRIEGRDELARESELIAAPAIVDRGSIAAPRPQ